MLGSEVTIEAQGKPRIQLILHNIRSAYNVGAILRTAEGLGVESVCYSGYTPRYNDPRLLPHLRTKLNHQIAKSALGAEEMVPQTYIDDLETWLKSQAGLILGLENNLAPSEISQRLILGQDVLPRSKKSSQNLILILGEEVAGIPDAIRSLVDYFLEIPMVGRKESFNVSIATAIALWGLLNH